MKELIIKENTIKGFITDKGTEYFANYVVIAPGREGADWLSKQFLKHKIHMVNNAVDVGVRVELPAAVMEPITSRLYESKYKNKQRKSWSAI